MKIKGSVKKMPVLVPVLTAAVPGAALIALRAVQCLKMTDPATGFFYDRTNGTVLLFFILMGAVALLTPIMAYLCPLSRAEGFAAEKRPLHAACCLLTAVAIVWDLLNLSESGSAAVSAANKVFSAANNRLPLATAVAGVLACVSLVVCAAAFFLGRDYAKKLRILHIFPVFWALCKTVSYLPINVSYLNNASLLTAIFADMFFMVFLFEYARKVSGLSGDGNSPAFLSTALIAAVFQLAATVAGCMELLPGREPIIYVPFAPYRIAAALLCVSAVFVLLRDTAPDYVPAAPQEEDAPAPADDED